MRARYPVPLDRAAEQIGQANDNREATVALEDETSVSTTDGGSNHILDRRGGKPEARRRGLVYLDLQERQAGGLLYLDVAGTLCLP